MNLPISILPLLPLPIPLLYSVNRSPTHHLYLYNSTQLNSHPTSQFHADNLSSAHIYLRIPLSSPTPSTPDPSTTNPTTQPETQTWTWDTLPPDLLTDLAQLTKANSIEGNKKDNVTVIYTPWSNLKKDGSMAVGQVGFRDGRKVRYVTSLYHVAGLFCEVGVYVGLEARDSGKRYGPTWAMGKGQIT